MEGLFNNKYRIASARLQHWDYATNGAYFVTICTHNRTHFFGECANGKMVLSTIGAIVQGFWFEIPKHFPFVQLGEFVVMPNHIHGILILDKQEMKDAETPIPVETLQCNVSTPTTPTTDKTEFFKQIAPKAGSVSTIVRSYKSVCTKHIHQSFPNAKFEWQTRFWDNIIQKEEDFDTISAYIINNPKKWKEDKFFESIST